MPPKAFISYSWTTPDHEAWVLRFAEELRSQAVDVILDKWDLREGHDANAFMEQMVSRDDIKKVIMICDKRYAQKSDQRTGGAGTEAQIISASLYTKTNQDKFVAVVRERDENGNAYLPTYYVGRIYIDLLNEAQYAEEFDRLLRWIYDQPLYVKPELGKAPAFLSAENTIKLATVVPFRRVMDAMKSGKDQSEALASEYLRTVIAEMERFRLSGGGENFDDKVVASIEQFLPYRNELIEFFLTVAAFRPTDEMASVIHRFFERLIAFNYPTLSQGYTNWTFDNFKFICNELFLYFMAAMISRERFVLATHLIQTDYYVGDLLNNDHRPMSTFREFVNHLQSFEARNQRLGLRKISLQASLIEERCKGVGVDFRHIMAADFVLYLAGEQRGLRWYPLTLLYASFRSLSFELFARAKSLAYFNKIKNMIGTRDINEFRALIQKIMDNADRIPRFDYESLSPGRLAHADTIGTAP